MIGAIPHLFRLARVGFVFVREGVLGLLDPAVVPGALRGPLSVLRFLERRDRARGNAAGGDEAGGNDARLSAALARLGPSYVKLGQFMATRPDVVGLALAHDLENLQDRLPPFSQAAAEETIARALDKPPAAVFSAFGRPIAAASIAQVHPAAVADAQGVHRVAVKVLRPDVAHRFRADLSTFYFIARFAERWSADARRLRLVEVVDTLASWVVMEMDLRLEAAALSEMAENTREDADFRVPVVDWDRTAREVLTMEWIEGTRLTDRAGLVAKGFAPEELARIVMQSFLRHALRDGFFHADMHPGNLFIDDAGRLVAVDFGIMGRLGLKERRFLAEILYGFITRDYLRAARVHFEAGYVPAHHSVENFAQAIRAIGEPIHNRTAEEISMARLLTLLFEITGLFEMRTRPELLLLQKTMVVVEGVARSLDPRLDMWRTAEPVVREWVERNLGAVGRVEEAVQGAGEIGRLLGAVPEVLGRGIAMAERLEAITRDGLVLAPDSVRTVIASEIRYSRALALALWAMVALLAWLVWKM